MTDTAALYLFRLVVVLGSRRCTRYMQQLLVLLHDLKLWGLLCAGAVLEAPAAAAAAAPCRSIRAGGGSSRGIGRSAAAAPSGTI